MQLNHVSKAVVVTTLFIYLISCMHHVVKIFSNTIHNPKTQVSDYLLHKRQKNIETSVFCLHYTHADLATHWHSAISHNFHALNWHNLIRSRVRDFAYLPNLRYTTELREVVI